MENQNVDPFEGMEETKVEYKTIKFGKVGNWFKGTLTDNTRQIKNNLSKEKEMQTVFVFKAQGGSLNNIIKKQVVQEVTNIVPGEFWSFITGKPALIQQLKQAKIGQVVGLRFAEIKEATQPGYDDTKIIKVLLGGMDDTYQGETQGDVQ
jgi:hypothetical protein